MTWYTWLEQGRPINPSVQVLDAIARTLRLDHAEREHLYRLADVPGLPRAEEHGLLDPQVQLILDTLNPPAAAVYCSRFDLLAWNSTFIGLLPAFVAAAPESRNAIWEHFTSPSCCNPYVDPMAEVRPLVAMLRAAFGRHLAEPAWTEFVRRLSAQSPAFARLWSTHDVAQPGAHVKVLRYEDVGEIRLSRQRLAHLAARPNRHCFLPAHLHTGSAPGTETDTAPTGSPAAPDSSSTTTSDPAWPRCSPRAHLT
ncbi:helix-turn-helix transcriptional regulator [Nonomuraea sp. SYSU D8015]|uniref:helix-turn-helix transcriptional regulator n=1 Tax=Nonomuraea sp. SYSU D8015 TaxID=2593644 RepID=UPI0021D0C213|nr:helix-turn-helix transcriptional regulator [Nonomuraea sp. SYSU D8015]